jgi:hypothetical protein
MTSQRPAVEAAGLSEPPQLAGRRMCERLLGPYAAHRKAHDEHSARLRKWNQAWRKRVEAERVRRTNPRGLVSAFPDAVESEEEYVGQWRSERRRWVVGTFNSP